VIGYNKRMRVLVWQGVNATPQLDDFLSFCQIVQLPLGLVLRHLTCQEQ
jgi:hypothetical protein